jgi:hypothetical protein
MVAECGTAEVIVASLATEAAKEKDRPHALCNSLCICQLSVVVFDIQSAVISWDGEGQGMHAPRHHWSKVHCHKLASRSSRETFKDRICLLLLNTSLDFLLWKLRHVSMLSVRTQLYYDRPLMPHPYSSSGFMTI